MSTGDLVSLIHVNFSLVSSLFVSTHKTIPWQEAISLEPALGLHTNRDVQNWSVSNYSCWLSVVSLSLEILSHETETGVLMQPSLRGWRCANTDSWPLVYGFIVYDNDIRLLDCLHKFCHHDLVDGIECWNHVIRSACTLGWYGFDC
jgi:hypothetical protein